MKILYDTIMSYQHLPYIYGGENPEVGFDCSGFVIDVLQTVGELPNKFDASAHGIYERYIDKGDLQSGMGMGALAFFGNNKRIRHIGIMIDNFRMMEAGAGDSDVLTVKDAIERDARIRIRPVDFRKDLYAIIKPRYERLTKGGQ